MKIYYWKLFFSLCYVLVSLVAGSWFRDDKRRQNQTLNDRPIIGILATDTPSDWDAATGKTYISANYVKYLEQAGARVVPIRGGQPEEYYSRMVNWTNGALIPGGAANVATSLIGRSARLMYDAALKLNKEQDYYPLWGTCWGFQMLCYLIQGENLLQPTDSANVSWPLIFTPGKNFPFYGVQWHPEKPSFNWNPSYSINHGLDAIRVGQYMANFFVNEARKSSHRFPSLQSEATSLIDNYKRTYFSDGTFEEVYYIDPKDS
ncbi:hypothetical protein EGW08_017389 [Elysia chlorotica]|uniref:folate gamma-glutamyl hydrolase n=1 Tax=Elysia chlorotica TaxID=188477 RepID=A0A3S0ZB04_ELYCH|nr:hypothetical protein EGW08_017389 [Elysia chlorotica]